MQIPHFKGTETSKSFVLLTNRSEFAMTGKSERKCAFDHRPDESTLKPIGMYQQLYLWNYVNNFYNFISIVFASAISCTLCVGIPIQFNSIVYSDSEDHSIQRKMNMLMWTNINTTIINHSYKTVSRAWQSRYSDIKKIHHHKISRLIDTNIINHTFNLIFLKLRDRPICASNIQ